jgi:hypothetical protein
MLKLGMKSITGVSRVTVKKSKNVSFWALLSLLLQKYLCYFLAANFCFIFRSFLSSPNQMSSRVQHLTPMSFLVRLRLRIWAHSCSHRLRSNSRRLIWAASSQTPGLRQQLKMMTRTVTIPALSRRTLSWWWPRLVCRGRRPWRHSRQLTVT